MKISLAGGEGVTNNVTKLTGADIAYGRSRETKTPENMRIPQPE